MAFIDVKESPSYTEDTSDSSMIVGTNLNGEDALLLVFLKNSPKVQFDEKHQLKLDRIDKIKVATISMSMGQAERFYLSLKDVFEERAAKNAS